MAHRLQHSIDCLNCMEQYPYSASGGVEIFRDEWFCMLGLWCSEAQSAMQLFEDFVATLVASYSVWIVDIRNVVRPTMLTVVCWFYWIWSTNHMASTFEFYMTGCCMDGHQFRIRHASCQWHGAVTLPGQWCCLQLHSLRKVDVKVNHWKVWPNRLQIRCQWSSWVDNLFQQCDKKHYGRLVREWLANQRSLCS